MRASAAPVPLYGLVLAGGASQRMGTDKALIVYHGRPQLEHLWRLLGRLCEQSFISIRPEQVSEPARALLPAIVDIADAAGPAAGILAAQRRWPAVAWLVVACDLPDLDAALLERVIAARDPDRIATAYRADDGLPEPLCAIWEPASHEPLERAVAAGHGSPREVLRAADIVLVGPLEGDRLASVNTPEERRAAERRLRPARSGGD